MHGKRTDRVAMLIKEELARALRQDVRDPRIGFVTITDVRVSDDLKHARIFYSVIGSEAEIESTALGLEQAAGYLQHEIADHLNLRNTPHLSFERDVSVEEGFRIDGIIGKIHAEKPLGPAREKSD